MPLHQGPSDSIGLVLQNHLQSGDWKRVDIAVAWINESISHTAEAEGAFNLLTAFETFLEPDDRQLHLTFGNSIRTSEREGIDYFRNLALGQDKGDVEIYVFRGSETFHPKMFMFSNDATGKGCLLVGSPNLTGSALIRNFEVILEISGDLADSEFVAARTCFEKLQDWPRSEEAEQGSVVDRLIFGAGDRNRWTNKQLSALLASAGHKVGGNKDELVSRLNRRIIDYDEFRNELTSIYSHSRRGAASGTKGGVRKTAERRGMTQRKMRRTRPMPPKPEAPEPDPVDAVLIGEPANVLWTKKLSNSDLGITPEGASTNVTATIKLGGGGRLVDGVYKQYSGNCPFDRYTYFVDDVFSGLEWNDTGAGTQKETIATITIFVQGLHDGEHQIRISHDQNRAYHEGQAGEPPTWLHTTSDMREPFCDKAFEKGYVQLCGEAGSDGDFELHFFANPNP